MKPQKVCPQAQRKTGLLVTLLILILALAMRSAVIAQGTLRFSNLADGVNAPFYLPDGVTKLGTQCVAVLTVEESPQSTTSAQFGGMTPYGTNSPVGYFDGGVVYVPGVLGGFVAHVRIEIWGAYSWEHSAGIPERCGFYGNPGLFRIALGGDATPPAGLPLGNGPIILGFTQLAVRLADTNTLTLSVTNPPSQFVLVSYYMLEHSSTLTDETWTLTGLPSWPVCLEFVIPRPSATAFYRFRPLF